jgi:hypothetical protein
VRRETGRSGRAIRRVFFEPSAACRTVPYRRSGRRAGKPRRDATRRHAVDENRFIQAVFFTCWKIDDSGDW